jgi:hypothetical protein
MKIGFLGNMNNAAFSTARYLRDLGHDCEVLIYNDEPDHFAPEQDSFGTGYRDFTRKIGWGDPAGFLSLSKKTIRKDTGGFDTIIGNGMAPAAMEKCGRRLDIFTPYGYDLYSLPFRKIVHPLRIPAYWANARYQKRGIRNCRHIFFDRTNSEFESLIGQFGFQGKRTVGPIPMLYDKEYAEENIIHYRHLHPAIENLQKLRNENDIIFLQHIRQVWKTRIDDWSPKGNDLLIRAYSEFIAKRPHERTKLILFEYGIDVPATKKLISGLGMEEHIVWLPRLARKFIMITLYYADLVIGELHRSWLTYGALSESLCMGKPFMHKRTDAEFKNDYPELYPMIHAGSVESVLAGLESFADNREYYRQMGIKGREWFDKYLVSQPLENLLRAIGNRPEA